MVKSSIIQKAFTKILLILILVFTLSLIVSAEQSKMHFYEETDGIFNNPERGFHSNVQMSPQNKYLGLSSDYTIARAYVRLDDFRDKPISSSFIADLGQSLKNLRGSGLKVILRFSYNFGPIGAPDAPKEIILQHINQLKPVLQEYADVIAVVQAGFVGTWGEWHNSKNGLDNHADHYEIAKALLDALPKTRMIQIRTPYWKAGLFDNYNALTQSEAYKDTYIARTGQHNDCFLTNEADTGTYFNWNDFQINGMDIEDWKAYTASDSLYTPMGGETCQMKDQRSDCSTALKEMKEMHWSYINAGFYKPVLDGWKDNGCYEEMNRRMGYRFKLTNAEFPEKATSGSSFALEINLENEGWASLFNPRPIYVVISGNVDRLETKIELDPRKWEPDKDSSFSANVQIPITFPEGEYDLALWMPDYYENLQSDPRYSIRFANEDVWDEANGYNKLGTITINTDAPIEEPEEETNPEDIEEDVEIIHPRTTDQVTEKSKPGFFEKIIEFIKDIWRGIFG